MATTLTANKPPKFSFETLADQHHTANDHEYSMVEGTKELLDIDLSFINSKRRSHGRFIVFKTKDAVSGGYIVHGSSFTGYNWYGSKVVVEAIQVVMKSLDVDFRKAKAMVEAILEKYNPGYGRANR